MANSANHPKQFIHDKNSCLTQGEGVMVVDGDREVVHNYGHKLMIIYFYFSEGMLV